MSSGERLARRVLRWRIQVLLLCAVLVAAAGTGLSQLRFDPDYAIYFGKDNPELLALREIEREFGRTEPLLFVVAPREGTIFTEQSLEALRELTRQARQIPYATAVYSLASHQVARVEGDSIGVAPLVPDGPLTTDELAALQKQALSEDLLTDALLAPNGSVAGVVAYFERPGRDARTETAEIAVAARALARRVAERYDGLDVRLTGMVMFNQALTESFEWDGAVLFPLAYVAMFAGLGLFFRRALPVLATVAVASMANAVALGVAGWLGVPLTTTSISAIIIVLTLQIAGCVHVLNGHVQRQAAGVDAQTAMAGSLCANARPMTIAALTTMAGFLSMNFSESPPFAHLGNLVAGGMAAGLLLSLTFLPALIVLFQREAVAPVPRGQRLLIEISSLALRRGQAGVPLALLACAILAACIPLNRFGDDYVKFFGSGNDFRGATEFANAKLTGMQQSEFVLRSGSAGGVFEIEYLTALARFMEWLRAQPEVVKAVGLSDLMIRLNGVMNDGATGLPSQRDEAAQFFLLFEMSLPEGSSVAQMVNLERSHSKISVQLRSMSSEALIAFDDRARIWLENNLPKRYSHMSAGIPLLFAKIARRNFESMVWGTVASFGTMILVLWFEVGSLTLAAASLLPNLLPLAVAFGLWGIFVGSVGTSLSVVASLTLGILDDDTVHWLVEYRRARSRLKLTPQAAAAHVIGSTGVALTINTVVLAGGFLVLLSSAFTLTVHMAWLTLLVLASALLFDMLVLPRLLTWVDQETDQALTHLDETAI